MPDKWNINNAKRESPVKRRSTDREGHRKAKRVERKRWIKQFLVDLGIWKQVEATNLKPLLLEGRGHPIELILPERTLNGRDIPTLRKKLVQVLNGVQCLFPEFDRHFSAQDYFVYIKPVIDTIQASKANDAHSQHLLSTISRRVATIQSKEYGARIIGDVYRALEGRVLIFTGRFDQQLYWLRLECGRTSDGRYRVRLHLMQNPARRIHVKIDGHSRPAFQCGQPFGPKGIHWICWPRHLVGFDEQGHPLPVYVQSHALNQLCDRLALIDNGKHMLIEYLWQSLLTPRFCKREGEAHTEHLLIEYWFDCHKLGYLPAIAQPDKVVITTFLFLTMDGTPEGDMLRRELKLTKHDKEYLGLDALGTFLFSDIKSDPDIFNFLVVCGWGHLFDVPKELSLAIQRPTSVDDIRKYLNFD
jgi:hypothetical protein